MCYLLTKKTVDDLSVVCQMFSFFLYKFYFYVFSISGNTERRGREGREVGLIYLNVLSRKTGFSNITAKVYSLCNEQNRILDLFTGKQKAEIVFKTAKSFFLEYHSSFHTSLSSLKFLVQLSIAFITSPCFSDFQTFSFTKNWQNIYIFHYL